jgi:hypothetical protein
MFLSNIEINISNSIFFCKQLMLLVEGSYDCCYIQIQAYILTTCEPRKTEGGDIIQGKSKCDLWQRPAHK